MFYNLYNSITTSKTIIDTYKDCDNMNDYLSLDSITNLQESIEYINKRVDVNKASDITNISNVEHNIFCKGVFECLDELLLQYDNHNSYFQCFLQALNDSVLKFDKTAYFKVNEKEKRKYNFYY